MGVVMMVMWVWLLVGRHSHSLAGRLRLLGVCVCVSLRGVGFSRVAVGGVSLRGVGFSRVSVRGVGFRRVGVGLVFVVTDSTGRLGGGRGLGVMSGDRLLS